MMITKEAKSMIRKEYSCVVMEERFRDEDKIGLWFIEARLLLKIDCPNEKLTNSQYTEWLVKTIKANTPNISRN